MKIDNMEQYDSERTFHNCVVITVPGKSGFLWIEPNGEIHNSKMKIEVHRADVQVLYNPVTGKVSQGWMPN